MDALCLTDGIFLFIERCVCRPGGMWEIAVLCAEFCCDYKTTQRKKACFKTWRALYTIPCEYVSKGGESTVT